MHKNFSKKAADYQYEKAPGNEGFWMGYLAASDHIYKDLCYALNTSSPSQAEMNVRLLAEHRLKFIKNSGDIIRADYKNTHGKPAMVRTRTIAYNFDQKEITPSAENFLSGDQLEDVYDKSTSNELEGYFKATEHLVDWLQKTLDRAKTFEEMKDEFTEMLDIQKAFGEEYTKISNDPRWFDYT